MASSDMSDNVASRPRTPSWEILGTADNTVRALGESMSQRWVTKTTLCHNCRESQIAVERDKEYLYEITVRELYESDCEFCDIIRRAFHAYTKDHPFGDGDSVIGIVPSASFVEIQVGTDFDDVVRLSCTEGSSCPWGIVQEQDKSLPALGSSDSFRQVLSWISSCKTQHELCNQPNDGAFVPTRLLDLGSSNDEIRLIETGAGIRGPYICLSHCWGGKKPLITTKQNLAEHLKSIPWRSTPRTFQDAICYTRLLRIRYIWIDSLCIIQDQPDDWAEQSTAMDKIYSNSYLTIGAVTAPDSSAGMFGGSSRSPLTAIAPVWGTTISGMPYMYNVFKLSNRSWLHPESWRSYNDRKLWPLLGRAWAFQERMLSPRFLHIGYPEMRWECREAILCHCGNSYASLKDRKAKFASVLRSGDVFALQQQRREVIEAYSLLVLTRPSDKLPAFSGLAKQLCRGLPASEYLAGLYRDSLIVDLLWFSVKHDPDTDRYRHDELSILSLMTAEDHDGALQACGTSLEPAPQAWRAPSWSWASLDSHVVFPLSSYWISDSDEPDQGSMLEAYMEVIEAKCTPATRDPTGQIKSGHLIISGPAFDCTIKLGQLFLTPGDSVGGTLQMDYPTKRPIETIHALCIRAARFRRVRTSISECTEFEYLLLLEKCGHSNMMYQRIGVFVQQTGQQSGKTSWLPRPSSFESGGRLEMVMVI